MIKSKLFAALACVTFSLFVVACGSTPEPEPAPVKPEPVEEEAPVIESEEESEVQEGDFADANASLLAAVEESRKRAKDAGAEDLNGAAYKAAEAEYEAQKALINEGTNKDLSAALKDLNSRYIALAAIADAKAKKDRIDSEGYASYNKKSYDSGVKKLDEVTDESFALLPGSVQLKNAQTAVAYFDAVLTDAFRALAKDARKKAVAAKKDAESVKAEVSRKSDYEKAVKLVTDGDSLFVTGGAERAVDNYNNAASSFKKLYEEISVLRAQTQKAVDSAKQRVAQSEQVAIEADAELPLGDEKVEGIEDEDAQLLEADDFSAQDNSAIELTDEIDVDAAAEVQDSKTKLEQKIDNAVDAADTFKSFANGDAK